MIFTITFCVSSTADVWWAQTSQKVKLLSHQSTEYFTKSLWFFFSKMWDKLFFFFFFKVGSVCFFLWNSYWGRPAVLYLLFWVLLRPPRWVLEALRLFFGRPANSGKVHQCSKFSSFVDSWLAGFTKLWKWLCDLSQTNRRQRLHVWSFEFL